VQLVEALRYTPEGHGVVSFGFFTGSIFPAALEPGINSTCNWNEHQDYPLGVKSVGTYSWQLCHFHVPIVSKLWKPRPSRALRACPSLYGVCFTFTLFWMYCFSTMCLLPLCHADRRSWSWCQWRLLSRKSASDNTVTRKEEVQSHTKCSIRRILVV